MTAPVEIGGAGAWDGAAVIGRLLDLLHCWTSPLGPRLREQHRPAINLSRSTSLERIAYLSRDRDNTVFKVSRCEAGEKRSKKSQLNYAIAVPKRGERLRACGVGPRYIHKWVFLKKSAHKASQNANHQSAPTGISFVEVVWLSIRRIPGRFPSVQYLVHSEEV
jgi:hypothetical protein